MFRHGDEGALSASNMNSGTVFAPDWFVGDASWSCAMRAGPVDYLFPLGAGLGADAERVTKALDKLAGSVDRAQGPSEARAANVLPLGARGATHLVEHVKGLARTDGACVAPLGRAEVAHGFGYRRADLGPVHGQCRIDLAGLSTLCDPRTFADVTARGPVLYDELIAQHPAADQLLPLPLEFAAAALSVCAEIPTLRAFVESQGLLVVPANDNGTKRPTAGDRARAALRLGYRLNLPSAQGCLRRLQALGVMLEQLGPSQPSVGPTGDAICDEGFADETPLWIYLLWEVEAFGAGRRLGPLGTVLVADTLLGLAAHAPRSNLVEAPGSGNAAIPASEDPAA